MNRYASLLSASLIACSCFAADTITLKDGEVVNGRVSRYEKGKFIVDDGGEKPRTVRTTDIESIDFEVAAGNAGGQVAPVAVKPAQPAADQPLEGDELDAWKLARSHIARNHDTWMPDNAMPIRDALQVTATGDYLVGIPVATKPEPGFGQNYGIFLVQVTKFGTTLRVDGDSFQKTAGPFRPRQAQPQRRQR
jgi:hypothetical protein